MDRIESEVTNQHASNNSNLADCPLRCRQSADGPDLCNFFTGMRTNHQTFNIYCSERDRADHAIFHPQEENQVYEDLNNPGKRMFGIDFNNLGLRFLCSTCPLVNELTVVRLRNYQVRQN